jgi:hypothetical protein
VIAEPDLRDGTRFGGLLLYGVLHDARDPLGTQLSRRTRKVLAELGWSAGLIVAG